MSKNLQFNQPDAASSEHLDQFSVSSLDISVTKDSRDASPSHGPGSEQPAKDTPDSAAALSTYVGFSAQSAAIPSISCNTADTFLTSSPSPHSRAQSASSFTPSSTSSSLHSLASPCHTPAPDLNNQS